MTIILSEKLKASGADAQAASLTLPRNGDGGLQGEIALRHLSPSGEFMHSVRLAPGMITVIQETGHEPVRNALIGNDNNARIDLRAGNKELHRSEIFHVGDTSRLVKESTVMSALLASGVPAPEAPELLQKLGLQSASELRPRDLNPVQLKRLAIGCSAYARARLLLIDRPFAGSDPASVERIAQLLLQVGETNARALIITGESQIPSALRNHPRVLIQDPAANNQNLSIPARDDLSAQAARNLLHASVQAPRVGEPIVTRPQSIYFSPRQGYAETVHSEAIANPNSELRRLGGGAGVSQLSTEARQSARKDGIEDSPLNEYKRQKTRPLTKVGMLTRTKQGSTYKTAYDLFRKLRARISARPMELDIPPAARLLEQGKKRDLRVGTMIFVVSVLAICALVWMSR
ncbi:MAG: hypothetical protein U0136_12015 [Bdellovibrionota bacterium]